MRKKVTFEYQGSPHSGYIIESVDCEPHYYWLFFSDLELVKKFGDSIGFKKQGDGLVPTQRHYTDSEFIEKIKNLILSRRYE